MSPQEISNIAEHAAQQSDRYLFLLILGLVLAGGAALGIWLLRYVKELVAEIREDGKEFSGVVIKNTEAFSAQRDAFNDLVQEMRRR